MSLEHVVDATYVRINYILLIWSSENRFVDFACSLFKPVYDSFKQFNVFKEHCQGITACIVDEEARRLKIDDGIALSFLCQLGQGKQLLKSHLTVLAVKTEERVSTRIRLRCFLPDPVLIHSVVLI